MEQDRFDGRDVDSLCKRLESTGLSRNEARVFVALLYSGASNVGKIAEQSGVHRTNVYDALERLQEKGLVASSHQKGVGVFEAAPPQQLFQMVKEKEQIVQDLMPQLANIKEFSPKKSEAHVYEGLLAAKNMMEHMLEKGEPIYVYGVSTQAPALIAPFLTQFHKRRQAKKVQFNHIYNQTGAERAKFLNTLPYTEARVLPKEFDSAVATNICGDEVIMIIWQKKAHVVQIINQDIADSYRRYFNLLWGMSKKP